MSDARGRPGTFALVFTFCVAFIFLAVSRCHLSYNYFLLAALLGWFLLALAFTCLIRSFLPSELRTTLALGVGVGCWSRLLAACAAVRGLKARVWWLDRLGLAS